MRLQPPLNGFHGIGIAFYFLKKGVKASIGKYNWKIICVFLLNDMFSFLIGYLSKADCSGISSFINYKEIPLQIW